MRLSALLLITVFAAACGASPGAPTTSSLAPTVAPETTLQSTTETTAPTADAAAPTTSVTVDAFGGISLAEESPFGSPEYGLAVGAQDPAGEVGFAMSDVAPLLPHYATEFVIDGSTFYRYRQTVGRSLSRLELHVSETLGVDIVATATTQEILDTVTAQISQAVGQDAWEAYGSFSTDLTFGRQVEPAPLTRQLKQDLGAIQVAVATIDTDQHRVFITVIERHPDVELDDVVRPGVVGEIEASLNQEWTVDVNRTDVQWELNVYLDEGSIRQSVMLDVYFEATPPELREQLLATGNWQEHPDFPAEPQQFFAYSGTAWMQAMAERELTRGIVTASP